MNFSVVSPNLPRNKVTVVAVSCNASDKLLNKLCELKIEFIKTLNDPAINLIGHHADMSLLNISEGILFISETQESEFVNYLTKGYSLKKIGNIKSPYPNDCQLNGVLIGNKFICNPDSVCQEAVEFINNKNYSIIPVKQGYTKCSVCVINDNALITDDESIYKACYNNQINSALISKGSVKLDGFEYGFIGGCTGLIDKNKLLFNGDINYHKDCNKIIDFLKEYDIEPVILDNEPLVDIGSIIPLCEKKL